MIRNVNVIASALTFSLTAFAGEITTSASAATTPTVAQQGFFIGLGGSYNTVALQQDLSASGVSNIYLDSTLVAYGEAGGPAAPFNNSQSTFAPDAQLGYFKHFNNSDWLWGVKLSYSYLGTTSTNNDIADLQVGSYTTTEAAGDDSFTGHVTLGSSQTSVNDEFMFMPFIGHSFKNSYVYFGAGPALFNTASNLYNVTGYADINGTHVDITGAPDDFSSTQWMWGGAAQIGMAYYFDPTWFIDANYTYAATGDYTTSYSAPFSSETDGYTDTGTLYASTSDSLTVQAFSVSINKVFE